MLMLVHTVLKGSNATDERKAGESVHIGMKAVRFQAQLAHSSASTKVHPTALNGLRASSAYDPLPEL